MKSNSIHKIQAIAAEINGNVRPDYSGRGIKLSKSARALVIAGMNKKMAESPLPESRQQMINYFTILLMGLQIYSGFKYIDWQNGGYDQWTKDGQPQDNTKYLGDQTKIQFI